jgi:hypothetical protein
MAGFFEICDEFGMGGLISIACGQSEPFPPDGECLINTGRRVLQ